MRPVVEQVVYWEHITNIEHLKKQIAEAWKKISQETSSKCITEISPHSLKILPKEGKNFEHLQIKRFTTCARFNTCNFLSILSILRISFCHV